MKSQFLMGLFLITGALTATSVFAGTKDGGGGPSIICNGPDGKVKTAQLLDLYEGQIRYGLTIPKTAEPASQQLTTAFNRLTGYNWFIASDVEEALTKAESDVSFLPAGVIMAPGVDLGDSYAAVIPNGCQLAYVGYYEAGGTLRISKDIWDLLGQTDRAALFMHEALYMVGRNIGQQSSSLVAREMNGYLFSISQTLSAMDSAAVQISWQGRSDYINSAPVKVSSPEKTYSVEVDSSETAISSSDSLTLRCVREDGTYAGMSYQNPTTSSRQFILTNETGVGQVSASSDCRYFQASFMGSTVAVGGGPEHVTFTLRYGDQVILTQPQTATGHSSYANVPIYFDRKLVAPTNLPQ